VGETNDLQLTERGGQMRGKGQKAPPRRDRQRREGREHDESKLERKGPVGKGELRQRERAEGQASMKNSMGRGGSQTKKVRIRVERTETPREQSEEGLFLLEYPDRSVGGKKENANRRGATAREVSNDRPAGLSKSQGGKSWVNSPRKEGT